MIGDNTFSFSFTPSIRLLGIILLIQNFARAEEPKPAVSAPPVYLDWPCFRGPSRDGICQETKLNDDWTADRPAFAYKLTGLGAGYSGLSARQGKFFTMGAIEGKQFVIGLTETRFLNPDPKTNALGEANFAWRTPLSNDVASDYPGTRCTPTISGDRVYALSSDGILACLRQSNGELLWSRNLKVGFKGQLMSRWGFSESPLAIDNMIIVTPGGPQATVVALDATSGDEIWRTSVPSNPDAPPWGQGAGYSSAAILEWQGQRQVVQFLGAGLVGGLLSEC